MERRKEVGKERYRTNHRLQDEFHVFRHNPDRSSSLDLEESKSEDEPLIGSERHSGSSDM